MAGQNLEHRLLQTVVEKEVSEKLGNFFREIGELTKEMTAEDAKSTKLLVLEMVKAASAEFYLKMKTRIENSLQIRVVESPE